MKLHPPVLNRDPTCLEVRGRCDSFAKSSCLITFSPRTYCYFEPFPKRLLEAKQQKFVIYLVGFQPSHLFPWK